MLYSFQFKYLLLNVLKETKAAIFHYFKPISLK